MSSNQTSMKMGGWILIGLIMLIILPHITPDARAHQMPARRAFPQNGIEVVYLPKALPYLVALGSPPLQIGEPVHQYTPEPPPPPPEEAPPPFEPVIRETKLHPGTANDQNSILPVAPPKQEEVKNPVVPTGPKPIYILPDDTRNEVSPEDVLPFFVIPRGRSSSNVPSPDMLPQSSATYRQQ